MKHIPDEEAENQKCNLCEEPATHTFLTTVWNRSPSGASLLGDQYAIYLCCNHFIDLISKTQAPEVLEEVKKNCLTL